MTDRAPIFRPVREPDSEAKRVLIPVGNRRLFLEVPPDILERVDPIFYSEPLAAALKALGMG